MAFTGVTACLLAGPLKRPFPSKASAVSLPPLPLRLLPAGATVAGRELHPLKINTFSTAHNGTQLVLFSEQRSLLARSARFFAGPAAAAERALQSQLRGREFAPGG